MWDNGLNDVFIFDLSIFTVILFSKGIESCLNDIIDFIIVSSLIKLNLSKKIAELIRLIWLISRLFKLYDNFHLLLVLSYLIW